MAEATGPAVAAEPSRRAAGAADTAEIVEVSPRDGLQDEVPLPTEIKVRLLERLVAAGFRRIELTSFVSPKWIPPLADADELARRRPQAEGVVWSALVPNRRGLERALAARVDEVCVVVSASDAHNRANLNRSRGEAIAAARELVEEAKSAGLRVRGAIATAFGCPFEGDVPPESVVEIASMYASSGADEVVLADTIGVAKPEDVTRLVQEVGGALGPEPPLALHLHDREGRALQNALAGWEAGVRVFDAAVGGVGGCPYAPGAPGNLETSVLIASLAGKGIATGVSPRRVTEAGRFLLAELRRAKVCLESSSATESRRESEVK